MGQTAPVLDFEHSERQEFLRGLESKTGRHRYSRYNGLPLRYAGGKSRAVGFILEHIPEDVTRMVSPFFGGGAVEIACAREFDIEVQGFDVFDILVNYWQAQIRSPEELAERLWQWRPNKKTYASVKERLKKHWKGEREIKNPMDLAAHYWFNHNLSYGPGFLGWMSSIYTDLDRVDRLIGKVRDFSGRNLDVKCRSFERVLPYYKDTFLYCDPPYFLEGDSKMFRGIYPQRNFPIHHDGFRHDRLRDMLAEHRGGFVLSYNDCETIRDWYSEFRIEEVAWQYSLGQGETRMGKNRIERGDNGYVKESHEILIIGEKRNG